MQRPELTSIRAPRRWIIIALSVAAALLFFIENRAAYKGYFSADDLNNLSWPTFISSTAYVRAFLSPRFDPWDFRPVAFLYYRYLGRIFGLQYPPYVAVIQLLHAVNVVLLFWLIRRLGLSTVFAAVAGLFYAFAAVIMEAYWKPMFVFDVICCVFCLATLLLFVRGRWIAGLLTFWLAYKSKELAVMLPIALFAWEMLLGARQWKRLIPYFAVSLSFGLQAILATGVPGATSGYHLKFTPDVLWRAVAFYSSTLLLAPFAGLALLAIPLFVRDRRLYFGLITTLALLAPLLVFRERLEAVYWYVPLIGVAIVAAVIASRVPGWAIAVFFALWLPWNYAGIREKRRAILAEGDENRWYINGLREYARHAPPLKAVVWDNRPAHFEFGTEPAIKRVFGWNVDVAWHLDPRAQQLMLEVPMAVIVYNPATHAVTGTLRTSNNGAASGDKPQ